MIVVGCALAVALAACETEQGSSTKGRNRFGYHGAAEDPNSTKFASPTPTPDAYATPTPPVEETPKVTGGPSPTPAQTSATQSREMPYGTPVPGKPGFVTSPHSPYAGYVDVRGFPPGTEVKCPYSGKIFLVP